MIHYFTPYSVSKELGVIYNYYCNLVPNDNDYICIRDGDVMFPFSTFGQQIETAVKNYNSQYDLFTCYTNRISNKHQLYKGEFSNESNLLELLKIARKLEKEKYAQVKKIDHIISGPVLIFKKKLWKQKQFPEKSSKGSILGIETDWIKILMKRGVRIGLIEGLYVIHSYRLLDGKENISHLI